MWRRRSKSRAESDATREARVSAQRAEAERRRIEAQWPSVQRISAQLNHAIERNHFGESIELALRRKRAAP